MKRITLYMLAGVALIALASCSDDTKTKVLSVPSVTLSPTSVTLSAEAVDSYTINYVISNPADGAYTSATGDVSWISGIDSSVSGQIRFSVAANTSGNLRTGNLTLTYSYDDGYVTAKAAVVQYGEGDPALTVDPTAVVAGASGGTYSFGYSIENPIDGESVSCTTSTTWISGFVYDTYGKVSFTVASHTGDELRTGTISVSYAGLSKQVTVVQDHPGSSDGDSGSGDYGNYGDMTGTYTASGYGMIAAGSYGNTTWDLYIKAKSDTEYYVYCLTPYAGGLDISTTNEEFWAVGHWGGETTFVIPSLVCSGQVTGGSSGINYYLGYTPCTEYDGSTFSYNTKFPPLTFTKTGDDTWESDYGVFVGAFTTQNLSSISTYLGVVAPTITLTKTSTTVPSALSALSKVDAVDVYTDFMAE